MKSLLDIQNEIRILENNVMHIMKCIQNINYDIDILRNQQNSIDIDYSKIKILAKCFSFGKHPISKLNDDRAKKIYLEMLLSILIIDVNINDYINSLSLIQWIQMESKIDYSLENLFKSCYNIRMEYFYEITDIFSIKYKESFIVDALIISRLCGDNIKERYRYVVDLSTIFGIEKDRLLILSMVANTVLCQRIVNIKKKDIYIFQECANGFKHYIKNNSIKTIESLRKIIVEIPNSIDIKFKWKVNQNHLVSKGDIVAIYKKKIGAYNFLENHTIEEIKSPVNGMIYQLSFKGINYGVIGHELDNKESIKAWIKRGGR